MNRFAYEQDDGDHTPPQASKMDGIKIRRGQHLRLESPGGGGYGPALDREPERVAADVRLGYVSAEAAARDYGVAVALDGTLDTAATASLRKAAAE